MSLDPYQLNFSLFYVVVPQAPYFQSNLFFLPKCITLHLSLLSDICPILHAIDISFWISTSFSTTPISLLSSTFIFNPYLADQVGRPRHTCEGREILQRRVYTVKRNGSVRGTQRKGKRRRQQQ
jgi:hypothetical protein